MVNVKYMIENFEYNGEWFLPNKIDKKVSGTLKYSSEYGATLELHQWLKLDDDSKCSPTERKNHNIILGIANNGSLITLYKCHITNHSTSLIMYNLYGHMTTYGVQYILEGIHIDVAEDLKFTKLISNINNLEEWVGVNNFKTTVKKSEVKKNESEEFGVKCKFNESIKFQLQDDLEGQFNFPIASHRVQNSITITQNVDFVIKSSSELHLLDLLHHYYRFQNFLILALCKDTYPKSITLDSPCLGYGYNSENKNTFKGVKLYCHVDGCKSKPTTKMFFSYSDIKDSFPRIINNWYKLEDTFTPVLDLLFEQFYNNKRVVVETRFLNLAQAIEKFHRLIDSRDKMNKDAYKKMKQEILNTTNKEYHKWLNDKFNFGNELNLHDRLTDLVSKHSNIFSEDENEKKLFIKQVKDSRNYYTHYSERLQYKALTGSDLFYLSEKLKLILICAFLHKIGFDAKLLESCLERSSKTNLLFLGKSELQ